MAAPRLSAATSGSHRACAAVLETRRQSLGWGHLGTKRLRARSKGRSACARVSGGVSTSVDCDLRGDQSTRYATPPVLCRLFLVLTLAILSGFYQALGIASIMPFVAILADRSLAESNWFFILLPDAVPAPLQGDLVPATGLRALFAPVISNTRTILDDYLSLRLFSEQRYRLWARLLALYMGQGSGVALSGRAVTEIAVFNPRSTERK